jgi:transposase
MEQITVGIDTSKSRLDVVIIPNSQHQSFANDEEGCEQLASWLGGISPNLIAIEATGGYEMLAVSILSTVGLPIVVVNPRQVRNYAKALGKLAKTDMIDAGVIAEFAHNVQPEVRPLPGEHSMALKAMVLRRRQLIEMLVSEQNRLKTSHCRVQPLIRKNIDWLREQIALLDKDITKTLRSSSVWREKDDLLSSVKGVGPVLTASLICLLPELGTLNRQKISALVGVCPYNRDSGYFRGRRSIYGGRAQIRSVLYMATVASIRHNSVIKAMYDRLRKAGKVAKVAIVACMRKLLTILNAMVKNNQKWNPDWCAQTNL